MFDSLNAFQKTLEMEMLNPSATRLIDIDREYTPDELRSLLQRFGANLSTLYSIEGRVSSECHLIKESLKTGISVKMAKDETKSSVSEKEAKVMAENEVFKDTRRLQIDSEAALELVQGWRRAYEKAWETTSRLITLTLGEATLQTDRVA